MEGCCALEPAHRPFRLCSSWKRMHVHPVAAGRVQGAWRVHVGGGACACACVRMRASMRTRVRAASRANVHPSLTRKPSMRMALHKRRGVCCSRRACVRAVVRLHALACMQDGPPCLPSPMDASVAAAKARTARLEVGRRRGCAAWSPARAQGPCAPTPSALMRPSSQRGAC